MEEDQKTGDEIQTTDDKPEASAPPPPLVTSSSTLTSSKIEKAAKAKKIEAAKLKRRKTVMGTGLETSGGEPTVTTKPGRSKPSRQHSSQNQSR